jgi:DNA modification methylase
MNYLISEGVKVDAIITDPPYATTGYKWDKIIPFETMWECLEKLIKPTGAIVLFGNEPFSSDLRMSNKELYKYDWKWLKTQVTGFQSIKFQPLRCYEDIMVFSKGGIVHQSKKHMKYFPQDLISVNLKVKRTSVDYLRETKRGQKYDGVQEYANYPRNVIQFSRETNLVHPTQKPLNLMEYLIMTYTKIGDTVLDFTSGSGSTLVACELAGREWIGIEITDKYCNVIKKRLKQGVQLKMLFDYREKEKE